MNILITGGYGFIGSHVAEEFYKEGHHIFIIDNLTSGNPKNIRFKHTFFKQDIEEQRCREIFKSFKFDIVIHLAAQIDVATSIKDPFKDTSSNILGLTNMLQLSTEYGVKKFVFASSAAVYGDNNDIPLKEEYNLEPLSPYGMSKSTGEFYCEKWSDLFGLNVLCLRFSNVYGPRQGMLGEGGVISIFIERTVRGKELFVFGDGSQTRDFIYVKDVADAIYKSVINNLKGTFNLSTNTESSITELISTLMSLHPIKEICYKERRKGDIKNSRLDNAKFKQAMNWEPAYTLEDGLRRTLAWYTTQEQEKQRDSTVTLRQPKLSILRKALRPISNPQILFLFENVCLFLLTFFMSIVTQNSANYYPLDYKVIYIILSGVLYGLNQAIVSSLLSCLLCIYLYAEKGRSLISIISDTGSLLQLSFYILIALILGYIIDTKNNQLKDKDTEICSVNEELSYLNEIHETTLKVQGELYDQIVYNRESYGKIYTVMSKLNSQSPQEVLNKAISVLEEMMNTNNVSIYAVLDDTAILTSKSDIKDFFIPKSFNIKEREDICKVIETNDIYINYKWIPFLPIMVAPITNQGNVIAVACINSIAFENISLHRQNMLKIITNIISLAYTNACKSVDNSQSIYANYLAATTNNDSFVSQKSLGKR